MLALVQTRLEIRTMIVRMNAASAPESGMPAARKSVVISPLRKSPWVGREVG